MPSSAGQATVSPFLHGSSFVSASDRPSIAPAVWNRQETNLWLAQSEVTMRSGKNGSIRLLVVDDHPLVRDQLAQWLGSNGYQISLAADGEEAINRLAVESFDAVLSDVQMPNVNGFQLLQYVHQHYLHLPVVLMTAFESESLRESALGWGAVDLLQKPFKMEQLQAALAPHHRNPRLSPALLHTGASPLVADLGERGPLEQRPGGNHANGNNQCR
jgi:CheY-like chemotaxis protein